MGRGAQPQPAAVRPRHQIGQHQAQAGAALVGLGVERLLQRLQPHRVDAGAVVGQAQAAVDRLDADLPRAVAHRVVEQIGQRGCQQIGIGVQPRRQGVVERRIEIEGRREVQLQARRGQAGQQFGRIDGAPLEVDAGAKQRQQRADHPRQARGGLARAPQPLQRAGGLGRAFAQRHGELHIHARQGGAQRMRGMRDDRALLADALGQAPSQAVDRVADRLQLQAFGPRQSGGRVHRIVALHLRAELVERQQLPPGAPAQRGGAPAAHQQRGQQRAQRHVGQRLQAFAA
ncbi:MAG: hypothetical protein RLZZ592_2083 [Pseudomonadota bacterium]